MTVRHNGPSVEEKRVVYHVDVDLEWWEQYLTVAGEWLGR